MRKFVAGVALASMAMAGFYHTAEASSAKVAVGTYANVDVAETTVGIAGGDTYINGTETEVYLGSLTGTAFDTYTYVVHRDGTQTGWGTEVCAACTIGGKTGSYTAMFMYTTKGSTTTGSEIITHGAGGLKGLHGGGTFVETKAGNTYSYSYKFGK